MKNVNPVTERRFGKIRYTKTFLEDAPDVMSKLFAKVIPVRMEYDYTTEIFDVVVAFKDFESVETHQVIPTYQITIEEKRRKTGRVDPMTFLPIKHRAIYFTFRKM